MIVKRIAAGFKTEQHTDTLRADLAGHVKTGSPSFMNLPQGLAPKIRRIIDLQQQQRHRPTRRA